MKLLLFFFLSFSFQAINAQLIVDPDLTMESISVDSDDLVFYYDLVLEDMDSVWVHWEIINGDDMPSEWRNWLCDNISCYMATSRNCSSGAFKINRFVEGESKEWMFHLDPEQTEGSSSVTINTYYLDYSTANHTPLDFSDIEYDGDTLGVSSHTINIQMGDGLSLTDNNIDELKIFPNPTSNIFQLEADEYVMSIRIYNVVGKLVEKINHTTGQSHNIEHLNKGMYLVRLMNDEGQVIKTMKLSKR